MCGVITPPARTLGCPDMTDIDEERVRSLLTSAFGPRDGTPDALSDANEGRGVFSAVIRAELCADPVDHERPNSVIVKFPAAGPNGEAARRSGACRREALAYRQVLARSTVRAPKAHLVETDPDGSAAFVLEDLTDRRAVDQIDGLGIDDGVRVAETLRRFHLDWVDDATWRGLDVRRSTPSSLDPEALRRGLDAVETRWADDIEPSARQALTSVFERREELVAAFGAASQPTLCHGDPRADNLVFDHDRQPILFDWQQLAIQLGEADLAWLAATSFDPEIRRKADPDLISAYGTSPDRYRLGFVLPGLTVLLLAQRQTTDARSERFIATSLNRIGTALVDLEVGSLGR